MWFDRASKTDDADECLELQGRIKKMEYRLGDKLVQLFGGCVDEIIKDDKSIRFDAVPEDVANKLINKFGEKLLLYGDPRKN